MDTPAWCMASDGRPQGSHPTISDTVVPRPSYGRGDPCGRPSEPNPIARRNPIPSPVGEYDTRWGHGVRCMVGCDPCGRPSEPNHIARQTPTISPVGPQPYRPSAFQSLRPSAFQSLRPSDHCQFSLVALPSPLQKPHHLPMICKIGDNLFCSPHSLSLDFVMHPLYCERFAYL